MLQNDQNQLDYAMLPFVMRDLVNMVMKKKMLPLRDALYYIYSSKLYKSLLKKLSVFNSIASEIE